MKRLFAVAAVVLLAACSPGGDKETKNDAAPVASTAPAGDYVLDRAHASLIFRVSHMGFSMYTARFKSFDAALAFDPANPKASRLTARVDARSLETDYPDPAKLDFNVMLQNEQWLNTAKFPEMTFQSTSIEVTGANTGRIHGDFTLHGQTHPLVLDVTFNGGYAGFSMDPHARIGFSAHGVLKRSDYGVSYGIPAPGSNMGVGDNVDITIEAEFSGPPLAAPPPQG